MHKIHKVYNRIIHKRHISLCIINKSSNKQGKNETKTVLQQLTQAMI